MRSSTLQPLRPAAGPPPRRRAFTLIEILVVVAVIALLIAVLLPSLSRARQQARMVQCEANAHQLCIAFIMYSAANAHRLPGSVYDYGADWLGRGNRITSGYWSGRDPEDGVIFRYMGKNVRAYGCPDDTRKPKDGSWYRSYSAALILAGAKPEMILYGHYRQSSNRNDALNFSREDHTAAMRRLPGVPMIVEEDALYGLGTGNDEGGWCNTDCVSDRHLYTNGVGYGTLGFIDGSAGRAQLPPQKSGSAGAAASPPYFNANSMCLRVGRKWVNGIVFAGSRYGLMDHAEPAERTGVKH